MNDLYQLYSVIKKNHETKFIEENRKPAADLHTCVCFDNAQSAAVFIQYRYKIIFNKIKTVFMKKSTFIDYTVILAILSNRKKRRKQKPRILVSGAMENVNSISNHRPVAA
ncbi:MAG TPA: hypothetical protein VFE04_11555 [Puia sp.]|jgi:hypothetical protein|nr:hypothetical protein [Puia sp.]